MKVNYFLTLQVRGLFPKGNALALCPNWRLGHGLLFWWLQCSASYRHPRRSGYCDPHSCLPDAFNFRVR